ncbi:MAG: hypothetical protein Q7U04_13675 [Bacteriovorax sp.]|nr:hypothetical protein [Bacteriovorax sp.]
MDVNQKLDQARDKYRTAEEDLRSSYDKNTKDLKETFDNKINKQSANYANQKTKLEEQNLINNEMYSDKTKKTIADRQVAFRNDIKKNSEKFDIDRNSMKNDFSDKLSNLSSSYNKSTEENNRFHDQAAKTMGERYTKANQNYKQDFDTQVDSLNNKAKDSLVSQKENAHETKLAQDSENQANLESLRSSEQEQKFKEVSRLRNENESLRTNFGRDRESMRELQDGRIADLIKLKSKESGEGQKNISNLEQSIRQKSIVNEEKVKQGHQNESKELEKKFNDDIRNVQLLANQKIKGGAEVLGLKEENKQITSAFENRLQEARSESQKDRENENEKEKGIDSSYREKFKSVKLANAENIDRHENELNIQHKKNFQDLKEKNVSVIDRYKSEIGKDKIENENKLGKADQKSKGLLQNQRVEFGNYINTFNNNKMEELSSIKSEFNKDKSSFIEKTRKDISEDKISMKDEFNHQIALKDDIYEKKLTEMEKQTNKIIDNYEKRIGQIARKAENEVEILKTKEDERKLKETSAIKIAFESQETQHQTDLTNIRNKYEGMIGRDRAVNEIQVNRIVQKYEDQLNRERAVGQKDLSLKVTESDAKFERLFKASEMEKNTIRNQYEQRIENMKVASMGAQGNTKKV